MLSVSSTFLWNLFNFVSFEFELNSWFSWLWDFWFAFYLTKNAKATKLTLQVLKFILSVSSILDFERFWHFTTTYNFELILILSFLDSNFKTTDWKNNKLYRNAKYRLHSRNLDTLVNGFEFQNVIPK